MKRRKHDGPGVPLADLAAVANEHGAQDMGHAWLVMMAGEQNGELRQVPDSFLPTPDTPADQAVMAVNVPELLIAADAEGVLRRGR